MGKTTQTVLDVGKHYLNKGHRYFTDNYYTSVELMTKLQAKNNSNQVRHEDVAVMKTRKRGESLNRM